VAARTSCYERLPLVESLLTRNQIQRISEPEARLQYLRVSHVLEPGELGPDRSRNGVIPLTMPAQVLFCSLPEVFNVRHDALRTVTVGRRCPFGLPMRPTQQTKGRSMDLEMSTQIVQHLD
jgi:hypothetical protein